jgi:hypothetical protein
MEFLQAMIRRVFATLLGLLVVSFWAASASAATQIKCSAASCSALTKVEPFSLEFEADVCAVGAGPLKLVYEDDDGNRIPDAVECTARPAPQPGFACTFKPVAVAITRPGTLSTTLCNNKGKMSVPALQPPAPAPAAHGGRNGAGNADGAGERAAPPPAPPPADAGQAPESKLGFLPPGLWKEAIALLDLPLAGHRLGHYYDQKNDVAVLFFDADATPYFPLPDVIDEDDDIYVAIVDYKTRLENAKVAVNGCDRPPVEPRILGKLPKLDGAARGTGDLADQTPDVGVLLRAFGKCAGAATGGPQLTIERNNQQKVATVSVNQLYRLAVGLAFGYDTTSTRTYAVRAPAGSSVTRVAESKDRLGVTPLVFVSYYPVARDFRKTKALAQRFQLVVGMDTENFMDNIVLGAGYELTMGLNVVVGWRALSKQKVLAEGSGLKNGSTFDGTTETLPLRDRWTTGGAFLGFGLNDDLLSRLK